MEISTDKIIRRKSKEKIVYCLGGECQICGYKKCNDALHLHHIDPSTKSFTVGGSRSTENNWEIIKEEIKKCILLCGNCHSEYHNGNSNGYDAVTESLYTVRRYVHTLCWL